MNRNVEAHFSQLPDVTLSRSTFDMSSTHTFTGNSGVLIPFYVTEVLPGDTMEVTTSKVVRLQTLLTPIMDNVYLDVYWFFCPNRLVWDHWREFCGENTDSPWLQETQYQVPRLGMLVPNPDPNERPVGPWVNSIQDYMGISPRVQPPEVGHYETLYVNALPFRAYSLIWSEFFRDQNLQYPANVYTGDADYLLDATLPGIGYSSSSGDRNVDLAPVCKYHDYFTSCLPAPQKGPDVTIPMDPMLPVFAGDMHPILDNPMRLKRVGQSTQSYMGTHTVVPNPQTPEQTAQVFAPTPGSTWTPSNLWASMDNLQVATINNLRLAFQIQKLYEKDARGGTRYIEMLRSHFGVISSDARLQRPEYLGGNRIALNVNQVTNNAQSEQDFLGDLGAYSHTADVHHDFVKSFEEHGFLLGLCCIRYEHTYADGVERFWSRRNRFDYYWPVFANIGEQPVYHQEIYARSGNEDNNKRVFGYQEAWADYRYKPNRVSAEMRPGVPGSLASWNLADDYDQPVSLSPEWIVEDKSNLDRVLAVTSEVSNQALFNFYIQNRATRCMPLHSIPGLADHH